MTQKVVSILVSLALLRWMALFGGHACHIWFMQSRKMPAKSFFESTRGVSKLEVHSKRSKWCQKAPWYQLWGLYQARKRLQLYSHPQTLFGTCMKRWFIFLNECSNLQIFWCLEVTFKFPLKVIIVMIFSFGGFSIHFYVPVLLLYQLLLSRIWPCFCCMAKEVELFKALLQGIVALSEYCQGNFQIH